MLPPSSQSSINDNFDANDQPGNARKRNHFENNDGRRRFGYDGPRTFQWWSVIVGFVIFTCIIGLIYYSTVYWYATPDEERAWREIRRQQRRQSIGKEYEIESPLYAPQPERASVITTSNNNEQQYENEIRFVLDDD